jgi:hypothetical protein
MVPEMKGGGCGSPRGEVGDRGVGGPTRSVGVYQDQQDAEGGDACHGDHRGHRDGFVAEQAGTARVQDGPAGGSVVHAEVSGSDPDDEQIHDLLAETMQHLQRDVSDNFNAG